MDDDEQSCSLYKNYSGRTELSPSKWCACLGAASSWAGAEDPLPLAPAVTVEVTDSGSESGVILTDSSCRIF
jgi:hypothetical protein